MPCISLHQAGYPAFLQQKQEKLRLAAVQKNPSCRILIVEGRMMTAAGRVRQLLPQKKARPLWKRPDT